MINGLLLENQLLNISLENDSAERWLRLHLKKSLPVNHESELLSQSVLFCMPLWTLNPTLKNECKFCLYPHYCQIREAEVSTSWCPEQLSRSERTTIHSEHLHLWIFLEAADVWPLRFSQETVQNIKDFAASVLLTVSH